MNDTSKEVVFYARETLPPSDDLLDKSSLYVLTSVCHDLQVTSDFERMNATLTS